MIRISPLSTCCTRCKSATACKAWDGVVDQACCPATPLIELAGLNPEVSFQGIELSPEMIAIANRRIGAPGPGNIRVTRADITHMHGQVATQSADAVISSVVLHHLPSLDHLLRRFREVARILKPGGSTYITDFARFKAESSVMRFAHLNNTKGSPDLACYYGTTSNRCVRRSCSGNSIASAGRN